uniref:Putative secreted protein n=1 Tax=Anopheles darlingi TaxID=43151 RepID=A0A2M4D5A0_ANODA
MLPVDAFMVVLLLLELEDVLHEELLQVFVRKVNAKLFEAVVVKVLEAKDVQHTDCASCRRFRFVDRLIDLLHDQHEQTAVDALHERIPHVHRLIA